LAEKTNTLYELLLLFALNSHFSSCMCY